jgi:hypothetical protein
VVGTAETVAKPLACPIRMLELAPVAARTVTIARTLCPELSVLPQRPCAMPTPLSLETVDATKVLPTLLNVAGMAETVAKPLACPIQLLQLALAVARTVTIAWTLCLELSVLPQRPCAMPNPLSWVTANATWVQPTHWNVAGMAETVAKPLACPIQMLQLALVVARTVTIAREDLEGQVLKS